MNPNQEIIIELFEEHAQVNFYSIRFSENDLTETDYFFDNALANKDLEEDINILSKLIDKIGENGANPRHFRFAGSRTDKVTALPEYLSSSNLRLYAIRVSEKIVILGNGGLKTTKTYNEDPFLNKCVEILKTIDRFLDSRLKNESVFIFRKQLMGNLKFYFKNEKK